MAWIRACGGEQKLHYTAAGIGVYDNRCSINGGYAKKGKYCYLDITMTFNKTMYDANGSTILLHLPKPKNTSIDVMLMTTSGTHTCKFKYDSGNNDGFIYVMQPVAGQSVHIVDYYEIP